MTIKNYQHRQERKDLNYYEYKISGSDGQHIFLVAPARMDDAIKGHITYFGEIKEDIIKDKNIMSDWGLSLCCIYTEISNSIESFTHPLLVNANCATYMTAVNQLGPNKIDQGSISLCDCGARKCGYKDEDTYNHGTWCTTLKTKIPF